MEFKTECGFDLVNICSFDFVKIGEAYLCDQPLNTKSSTTDWLPKLKLVVDEKILDAEQSVYLVFKNDEILYVGYYSNSFRKRWWVKKGYFWHGDRLDHAVDKLLRSNENISVTVWLSVYPYKGAYNISKLIEDEIIAEYSDKGILNVIGKNLKQDKKHTSKVKDILKIPVSA